MDDPSIYLRLRVSVPWNTTNKLADFLSFVATHTYVSSHHFYFNYNWNFSYTMSKSRMSFECLTGTRSSNTWTRRKKRPPTNQNQTYACGGILKFMGVNIVVVDASIYLYKYKCQLLNERRQISKSVVYIYK
jgi:hypothetical protein